MIVIDANTGTRIVAGQDWSNVNGLKHCLWIRPGIFSVQVVYINQSQETFREVTLTLPIRFLHPSFLFRRVAFFPS